MDFNESDEHRALRKAVSELGTRFGFGYMRDKAKAGQSTTELWREAAGLGFLGVHLPEEYGGGGAGMYELALVQEELAAAGCSQLMMVVSPTICGTLITRFGTEGQKERWLPPLSDGSVLMAFGITEPDAGSNSHNLATTARRDGQQWVLNGRKIYVSGVDQAAAVLIVARTEDSRNGRLKPALFIVPTDTPGFEYRPIDMDTAIPEKQFLLFLDEVRLPADALVGSQDAGLAQLFAGLNPERIAAAAMSTGVARYALGVAASYAKERVVWGQAIGAHQGVAHPLAQIKIELELARLMMQKAASAYDAGDDKAAGEAANMAKYAAAEVGVKAADQAVQTLGGNGFASEYNVSTLLASTRIARVAPVSREMILNFVAQSSLGLPKSY